MDMLSIKNYQFCTQVTLSRGKNIKDDNELHYVSIFSLFYGKTLL